jgi:hypothetical protein
LPQWPLTLNNLVASKRRILSLTITKFPLINFDWKCHEVLADVDKESVKRRSNQSRNEDQDGAHNGMH